MPQAHYLKGAPRSAVVVMLTALTALTALTTRSIANPVISKDAQPTIITLKAGATIEGIILEVAPEFLTLHTSKGQLVIPIKSLNDQSRAVMEKKVESLRKQQKEEPTKANPRLISTIFEEKQLKAQQSEGDGIRIRFGRNDFVYRRFSGKDQKREYLFTPVGETQVFDSEESLKIVYNEEITNMMQAYEEAEKQSASLGNGGAILPPSHFKRNTRNAEETQVTFAGIVEGQNGNPNKATYGKVIKGSKGNFATLIYTYFGREMTLRETQAWLGRNFERIGIIMDSLEDLPSKEELEEVEKAKLTEPITQE